MNIFEDLIDELKEDNLLEGTIGETNAEEVKPVVSAENNRRDHVPVVKAEEEIIERGDNQFLPVSNSMPETEVSLPEILADEPVKIADFQTNQETPDAANGAEFFRKRAIDEVSFLQMVEHVFAGIEREQMKIVPKPFDALEVKKVLHQFLQVSKESNQNEQAQAEFQLLQETENWYSALTHRDRRISINHLRRYCESTRPPLSPPALVALARFYRNSPYSEQARGKFDFVVTRLFSKDIENEHRQMAFSRDELIVHLKELYAEWSSIPLYSVDEDDSDILLMALKFEDFMTEAAVTGSFDELIKNDFFNRLRLFKKETNENFFSPLIVAADIESNITIGNRYIELLEKEKANKSIFEDKYGFLHDQTISDATGKTFQLVELLSRKTELPKLPAPPVEKKDSKPVQELKPKTKPAPDIKQDIKKEIKPIKENFKPQPIPVKKTEKKKSANLFGVNKWLLTATIFTLLVSFGLYFWANSSDSEAREIAKIKNVNLDNSSLKENIQSARIGGDIFFAVVLPSWTDLNQEKKEEILKKIISLGAEKGFKQVQLLDNKGKIVGFASPQKVEVYNP